MKKSELEAINLLKQKRRELDNYTCGYCRETGSINVILYDPIGRESKVTSNTNMNDLTTTCRHCCAIIVNYTFRKCPLSHDIELFSEAQKKAIESAERHKMYAAYIGGSSKWESLRQARILKDKGKCSRCSATKNLHVHHVRYERLFDEDLDDLITLCGRCHRKEHEQQALRRFGLL